MSVPIRLYRSLLRACRRFDLAPQPRSIEPLLNSPVVLQHAGLDVFLGATTATSRLRECFRRPIAADDAVKTLDNGFHCLRVLQQAEDLGKEHLVAESDDFEDSDDEEDDDGYDEQDHVNKAGDQPCMQRIAIFPHRPHFVHEPFELYDLLNDKNPDLRDSDHLRHQVAILKKRCSEQLTLDLISALENEDALAAQSVVSDILNVSVHLIPRHMISSVVESCCSTLNCHLIFSLFEKLREEGVTISPKVLLPLLQHAGEYDDVSTALATLRETVWASKSVAPVAVECDLDDPQDIRSLHAVMWICSNVCQHAIVEDFFKLLIDRGVRPNNVTLVILIRSICSKQNPDISRAVELISMFEKEWNIHPCSDVFNLLLFSFYNSPAYNLHDAIKLLRQMERRQIQPTKESYQALLLCAAKDEKERVPNTSAQLNSIMTSLDSAGFNVNDLINDIASKLAARWRL